MTPEAAKVRSDTVFPKASPFELRVRFTGCIQFPHAVHNCRGAAGNNIALVRVLIVPRQLPFPPSRRVYGER